MDTLEQRTMARVSARVVPFLIVCYFVAYLDRVNISFAALTMNKDLNLSASAYGLGAGIFFLAYGVLEVPSNLLMGMIKDATGSFTNGLLVLVGVALVALVIVLLLRHDTALERIPALESSRAK